MLVVRLRFIRQLRFQRAPLAQEPPQHGIDIPLGWPKLEEPARLHRFIHDRVFAIAARLERIERTPEQRFDQRVGAASPGKAGDNRLHTAVAPQRAMR